MTLIVYYVVFMVMGDFSAYFLGLFSEYEWGTGKPDRLLGSLLCVPVGVLDTCRSFYEAKIARTASDLRQLAHES